MKIAVIAHDGKKADMVAFVMNISNLSRWHGKNCKSK
jgi:methylglyoxal synthase